MTWTGCRSYAAHGGRMRPAGGRDRLARNEARLFSSLWNDDDFLAMSSEAQRAYMFLLSQPDLEFSGVIPLRVRKWSKKAAGLTVGIVADRETEELLIRTLIRGDGIFRQPNLLRAARKHLATVESPKLLAAVRCELVRALAELGDGKTANAKAELEAMIGELPNPSAESQPNPSAEGTPEVASNPSPNPSPNPSMKGAGNPSANPLGERGMVTAVTTGFPSPLAPFPDPPPSLAALATGPPTAQDLVAEWVDRCKVRPHSRTVGAVARHVKVLLDEMPPEVVRDALEAWRIKGADPSALYGFANQVANANPRASPNGGGLVERNGLRLKPETAQRLDGRSRWENQDAKRAIGGPSP
jgi:hypothetical protein